MTDEGLAVVVAGVGSAWGGALAAALEREPGVRAVVGVDRTDPSAPLRRAEALRVADVAGAVGRVGRAIAADVLVDARPLEQAGEDQRLVEQVAEVLLAAGRAGVGRSVLLSSADVYGASHAHPGFLLEGRDVPARGEGARQRALLGVEGAAVRVRGTDLREVAVLRAAEVLGAERPGPLARLLAGGLVPAVVGIDPRVAVVGADDLVRATVAAVLHGAPPALNVAADGVLSLGELCSLAGARTLPLLPLWGVGPVAGLLARAGLPVSPDLRAVLRHGRGLDTRVLRDGPAPPRRTARELAAALAGAAPRALEASTGPRWEPELEAFLRWSPVARPDAVAEGRPTGLGGLATEDLLAVLPSLPRAQLRAVLRHERAGAGRPEVLAAIERLDAG